MIDPTHTKLLVTREFVEEAHPAYLQRDFRTLTICGKKFRIVRMAMHGELYGYSTYYCESHDYRDRRNYENERIAWPYRPGR